FSRTGWQRTGNLGDGSLLLPPVIAKPGQYYYQKQEQHLNKPGFVGTLDIFDRRIVIFARHGSRLIVSGNVLAIQTKQVGVGTNIPANEGVSRQVLIAVVFQTIQGRNP